MIQNMTRIVERINNIEERFSPQPKADPKAFSNMLQAAENKQTPEIKQRPMHQAKNRTENTYEKGSIKNMLVETAQKYGVNSDLVLALANAESGYRADAVSPVGAVGVMQLMPETASGLGVADSFDPKQNIDGGVRYLKQMLEMFGGDQSKALAAYNAGPGAVQKYGGIPPYSETQAYVKNILYDINNR